MFTIANSSLSPRRQKARERQQKLLAEFASRQKSFMETAMDVGKVLFSIFLNAFFSGLKIFAKEAKGVLFPRAHLMIRNRIFRLKGARNSFPTGVHRRTLKESSCCSHKRSGSVFWFSHITVVMTLHSNLFKSCI